jgi:hypothetical protein
MEEKLSSWPKSRERNFLFGIKLAGLRPAVFEFLSLPIPMATWKLIKDKQNDEFVAFVESCLNWK